MKIYNFLFVMLIVNPFISGQAEEIGILEEIVVTARPLGFQSLEHITQPVTVLGGDELRKKQTSSIGETLAQEVGVTASDFGQGASRPIIRGLGGPRLRVMQDSIGSLDVSSISVDHNVSVNPMQAEQIEIIRGPATLLYGSGNSAGLINVVTQRIPEYVPEFEAALDTRYTSASDGKSLGLKTEGGIDNLALHFDFFKSDTDDYESAEGTILNSATEISDLNLGTSYVGQRGFLGFSLGHYESIYEIPFNPEEPDELVFIDLEQDRYDFAGQLSEPLPGFSQVRLRAAFNEYTHTEFEGPGEPGTVFFNDEWETRLEAAHQAIGPWSGVIGLQYTNRSFSAVGDEAFIPPTKLRSTGIFIFEDTDWRNVHFELGGRYEFQDAEPTANAGLPEVDHDVYSVSAGAQWQFNNDYSLSLHAARAQRAPALEELFASGPHLATETFEVGDSNLDAETSNNLDFSLGKTQGRWTWNVNLFINIIEDFIFQQFQDADGDGVADEVDEDGILGAGDLLSIRYEQNDALFYGAEAESVFNLYEGPQGNFSLRLFGDVVYGELDGGDDLPRISPARLGSGLEFDKGTWHANLDVINVFEQDNVAQLETETDGYILLNAGAGYDLETEMFKAGVFLQASNLLDEEARRHTSFIKDRAPLPGRSVMLGLRLNF